VDTRALLKAFHATVFVLSFSTGFFLHDKLRLPFSNPWHITSPLAAAKYNPTNDIFRFVFLITLPCVVLMFCRFVGCSKMFPARAREVFHFPKVPGGHVLARQITWVCAFAALALAAGNTYNCSPLDTFHEGETLGPAVDYMHGKVPYRDAIFIHGVFRDPLRSVLAFGIFGKSIGAVRTFNSCLSILTLGVFFVASFFLYKKNIYYAALSTFLLLIVRHTRPFGVLFHLTLADIAFLIIIILATLLEGEIHKRKPKSRRGRTYLLLALFTFVPTVSFANSIDRGYFLTAASMAFLSGVYVFFLRRSGWKCVCAIFTGYLSGIVVLGFAIKGAYVDFFQFAFLVLPRYDPLLNGYIYPFKDVRFLAPVLCVALILYWLTARFLGFQRIPKESFWQTVREFYLNYFMEILLVLLCLACYRRVLGRSDLGHLADAIGPIAILLAYIIMRHYVGPLIKKKDLVLRAGTLTVIGVFLALFGPKINWATWYRFPLHVADDQLIPESYLRTISFLKDKLGPGDDFITMTSEPIWYYFLDRPCPVRFQSIYQAMPPFYQQEVVDDLRKSNVRYVLFRNSHWANDMDGFSTEIRIPMVFRFITANYVFSKKIDDNEIWVRRPVKRDDVQGTEPCGKLSGAFMPPAAQRGFARRGYEAAIFEPC